MPDDLREWRDKGVRREPLDSGSSDHCLPSQDIVSLFGEIPPFQRVAKY